MSERNLCKQGNWLYNTQLVFTAGAKWILPLFEYRTSKFLQNVTFYHKSSIKPSLLNSPSPRYYLLINVDCINQS